MSRDDRGFRMAEHINIAITIRAIHFSGNHPGTPESVGQPSLAGGERATAGDAPGGRVRRLRLLMLCRQRQPQRLRRQPSMRIAGELLQGAVAEQDDAAVADEAGAMLDKQPPPFIIAACSAQIARWLMISAPVSSNSVRMSRRRGRPLAVVAAPSATWVSLMARFGFGGRCQTSALTVSCRLSGERSARSVRRCGARSPSHWVPARVGNQTRNHAGRLYPISRRRGPKRWQVASR